VEGHVRSSPQGVPIFGMGALGATINAFGSSAGFILGTVGVLGTGSVISQTAITTISTSTATTMVSVINAPTPIEDYFTSAAAQHILQMEHAGLDEDAPERERAFFDWLNRD
jgi:hypothetical protein